MENLIPSITSVLVESTKLSVIPLRLLKPAEFEEFHARASASFTRQMEQAGFNGKDKQCCALRDDKGMVAEILCGVPSALGLYTLAVIAENIKTQFSNDFIKSVAFKIERVLSVEEANNAALGWALASYRFDHYKKDKKNPHPILLFPQGADQKRVAAMFEGICLAKNLINLPANDLNTDELANASERIAKTHNATFSKISGKDLINRNFPMIYEVGKGSDHPPHFVELNWGRDDHPRVTLVGKGVVFDTGGLDIKPPAFMGLMKKDMGGTAHVLGLAHIIMALGLPLRLRVLVSIAENSIGGNCFRPGDVIKSRKGLSVEIGDTDAEGRLVLGDALTYACEGAKPDLIVDFATLTGSARAALGHDIPALFSNNDDLLDALRDLSMKSEDPLWPMPLWQPYLAEMKSPIADLSNIGSGKAGAIHGALFLQQFIDNAVSWIHIDCYAWEQSGKAGRPQGGADTGLRSMLAFIERRYNA